MSPWASPIVVVPKKSQPGEPPKKRLCIDFRKINDLQQKVITEGKSKGCLSLIPLPKIDEMYAKLKGAKFFSTIYNKPTSMYGASNNTPLTNSSDIVGEVTLKTLVDGYRLLKVDEMIKNAVAWRVRMPKASKFSKYFNENTKEGTQGTPEPKVHINEATLEVMGQAAKDFGYTEQEFVEAVEMYQYFGNQNLEDVPIPNSQD